MLINVIQEKGNKMDWNQIIEDQTLQNLPYKIELNERGNIVMSPASNKHGALQAAIVVALSRIIDTGKIVAECSVKTRLGVKVADVAWCSESFFREHGHETPYRQSPELCVEVVSPSNSKAEIDEKIDLFLAKGAKEVWICDENGRVSFFLHKGVSDRSELVENFPSEIESP